MHCDGRESRIALAITGERRRGARFVSRRAMKIDAVHFGIYEPSFRRFEMLSIAEPFEIRRGDVVSVSYFSGALWVPGFSAAAISRVDGREEVHHTKWFRTGLLGPGLPDTGHPTSGRNP